jgi:hypothetical protein
MAKSKTTPKHERKYWRKRFASLKFPKPGLCCSVNPETDISPYCTECMVKVIKWAMDLKLKAASQTSAASSIQVGSVATVDVSGVMSATGSQS